jgi:hypothetical protein
MQRKYARLVSYDPRTREFRWRGVEPAPGGKWTDTGETGVAYQANNDGVNLSAPGGPVQDLHGDESVGWRFFGV